MSEKADTEHLSFDVDFECGNGNNFRRIGTDAYQFDIRPDTHSEDRQWFYFRVRGARGRSVTFELTGTLTTNVPEHWELSRPVVSADRGRSWSWIRGDAHAEGDTFRFTHTFQSDEEFIAYHFPYGWSRLEEQVRRWAKHPEAVHSVIGRSVRGNAIHLLRVGEPAPGKIGIWVTARAHAAETTASFSVEGFIDFLLSDDPRAQDLRRGAVVHVVPMINPDGVVLGNYRDNSLGINLNRVWHEPSEETSPEIVAVRRQIDAWVDGGNPYQLFIDFHSDSSASSHYAFHPDASAATPLYADGEDYHGDVRKFLALVAQVSPEFNPNEGPSAADDVGISYHQQRVSRGVLGFIPEGCYGLIKFGPNAGNFITPREHRIVGEAFAIAAWRFYLSGNWR
jgi:hypothetical protein